MVKKYKLKQEHKNQLFRKQNIVFLTVMLIVPVVHWLIFWLYVNLNSIILAFRTPQRDAWTLVNFSRFFMELTDGGTIGVSVKNTLIYFCATMFLILPLSLLISYFIYKRIWFYKGFRIIFYLPAIISGVVMVKVFSEFIAPRGPLGAILSWLGKPMSPDGLLGQDATATATIVFYTVWTGFSTNMLLFGGAMTRVPIELLESARLEGCGPGRELVNIIFPLIWPTLCTTIIFTMTGVFTASGPILLFKPGGGNNTSTLAFWIFKEVYGEGAVGGTGNYGFVSATGLVFTLVGVPIILLSRWLLEKMPTAEY